VALWNNFTTGSPDKLRSAYIKCIKVFFGYNKFYNVTAMLAELNLRKFDAMADKCQSDFQRQIHACDNGIVQYFVYLHFLSCKSINLCISVSLYVCLSLSSFL